MIKKNIITLLAVFVALSSISATSIAESHYGHRLGNYDAKSLALGGTGTALSNSPFGMMLNATNLTEMNSDCSIQTTLNTPRIEDKRSLAMYNSFNAYINDVTYAAEDKIFFHLGTAAGFNYKINNDNKLGFGLYYQPKYSFNGYYEEEVRNNDNSNDDHYPQKIAINKIDNAGTLDALGFAFAYRYNFNKPFINNLALGVNIEKLQGKSDLTKTIRFTEWAHKAAGYGFFNDYTEIYRRDLDGLSTQFSLKLATNERTNIAVIYSPKTTINVDATSKRITTKVYEDSLVHNDVANEGIYALQDSDLLIDYDLPSHFKFAVSYRPRNIVRTTFAVEAEHVTWEDTNKLFSNEWNYYLGIEHQIIETVPVRIGFRSQVDYSICYDSWDGEDSEGNAVTNYGRYAVRMLTPTVSVGSGIEIAKGFNFDMGFAYSFRKYETLDLFPDSYYACDNEAVWPNTHINLQDRTWDNPDSVKENIFDVMCSIKYDFNL